ncbi:MAG: hypothetical protein A2835_03505 [Candidatus Niyogibacteria bacterium RIFCSPHIGHO2_01_FULL_45_28]|nr:MAG: hypothetical protein A2835_03505 [Candidatus Niyogibacteria bacterium RIFCSPHIGHO2_01_FULL_45_28]
MSKYFIASILIVIIFAVAGVYFLIKETDVLENKAGQNLERNPAESVINPKDYILESYPLSQSPIYDSLEKNCFDRHIASAKDIRLVKDQNILVPSLLRLVYQSENQKPGCLEYVVSVFSVPTGGEYLYFQASLNPDANVKYAGPFGIYALDLSDLSLKKLSVSKFVFNLDEYLPISEGTYQILAGGNQLVDWDSGGVYLINLETDTRSSIYKTKDGQWLVSRIIFGMGPYFGHGVRVVNDEIIVGVYDKTKTEDGYPIKIDQYGNIFAESASGAVLREFKPKFIENITLYVK